jgi:predicted DCC family thiol-disulfide oxidoreductase YuxK
MPAIILFDGVCNLCNGFVQFIIEHDPAGRFQFTALQSEAGQALLRLHGLNSLTPGTDPDSIQLLEDGRLYSHSTAVLRIARRLGGGWVLLAAPGWLLPATVRDALYRFVARNRYRWFGRQEACWLPTPALRARFLS